MGYAIMHVYVGSIAQFLSDCRFLKLRYTPGGVARKNAGHRAPFASMCERGQPQFSDVV